MHQITELHLIMDSGSDVSKIDFFKISKTLLEIDGIKVLEVYRAKIAFVTVLLDSSFSKMTSANRFGPKNLQS